jgi:hypothetical protein
MRSLAHAVAAVEIGMVVREARVEVLVGADADMLTATEMLSAIEMLRAMEVLRAIEMLRAMELLRAIEMLRAAGVLSAIGRLRATEMISVIEMLITTDMLAATEMTAPTTDVTAAAVVGECYARCGEGHRDRKQHTPPSSAVSSSLHASKSVPRL